ncbi:hypothetical protein B0H11DRAFT_1996653 [Mycena galericulata]|nr:hypothetical protein B0H11DRAFT_1996653 [Mycena galericulata]
MSIAVKVPRKNILPALRSLRGRMEERPIARGNVEREPFDWVSSMYRLTDSTRVLLLTELYLGRCAGRTSRRSTPKNCAQRTYATTCPAVRASGSTLTGSTRRRRSTTARRTGPSPNPSARSCTTTSPPRSGPSPRASASASSPPTSTPRSSRPRTTTAPSNSTPH